MLSHRQEYIDEFGGLAKKVDGELAAALNLAEEAAAHAHSTEQLEEFSHVQEVLHKAIKQHKIYDDHALELMEQLAHDANPANLASKINQVEEEAGTLSRMLEDLALEITAFTKKATVQAEHDEQQAQRLMLMVGSVGLVLALLLTAVVGRDIAKSEANAAMLGSTVGSMQYNVMVADNNDTLIYMNDASLTALRELAPEIRKQFSHFDPDKAIGSSIHVFHKDPERIKKVLGDLKEGDMHRGNINLGGLILELNVAGVFRDGKRIGSYAAWRDMTQVIEAAETQKQLEVKVEGLAMQVNEASKQIAEGNVNLSERTEAQAANIEETTATMQQVTEKVGENAENARQAIDLAQQTRNAADEGGEMVKTAISAMEEINASSSKINDIIGVIDEIAFQTNLLALNAAVEAARAGEQGRGFAVVASEVRTLAGRSANAAKEIKELITDSVQKVQAGSEQVNVTAQQLGEIITNVQKVVDMVSMISDASQAQSTSINEINKSVAQMDDFTQQNAALVEEAASASQSLQEQAGEMMTMMQESAAKRKEREASEA
jgi:methyl-accepting chemotaxis protein